MPGVIVMTSFTIKREKTKEKKKKEGVTSQSGKWAWLQPILKLISRDSRPKRDNFPKQVTSTSHRFAFNALSKISENNSSKEVKQIQLLCEYTIIHM